MIGLTGATVNDTVEPLPSSIETALPVAVTGILLMMVLSALR